MDYLIEKLTGLIAVIVVFGIIGASTAAWVNHLIICFTNEQWGFLIAGAIFFPVAVVHGGGAFFGFW